jgi:uncharacterized membrane protein YccF (DUF307 family)
MIINIIISMITLITIPSSSSSSSSSSYAFLVPFYITVVIINGTREAQFFSEASHERREKIMEVCVLPVGGRVV